MTREDIIRMGNKIWGDTRGKPMAETTLVHLEAFAKLVAAAEREACAKMCDEWGKWNTTATRIADEIRARGEP